MELQGRVLTGLGEFLDRFERSAMLTTLFYVSYAILWLLLLGMGFLLVGTLRSLGVLNWKFEELQATRPAKAHREGLKVGVAAPAFSLPDLVGVHRSLESWAGRRRLLVFVQPGCSPCHKIVPDLNKIQQAGDVQVIGIINGSADDAQKWVSESHAEFPMLRQDKWDVSKAYKMFATPFGYLIDERGKVASRGLVGSAKYLDFVLTGAGNDSNTHDADAAEEPAASSEAARQPAELAAV